MEMESDKGLLGFTIACVFALGILFAGWYIDHIRITEYKQHCIQNNGTPLYNGEFYQCIKNK